MSRLSRAVVQLVLIGGKNVDVVEYEATKRVQTIGLSEADVKQFASVEGFRVVLFDYEYRILYRLSA